MSDGLEEGGSSPLGATPSPDGVNFSVFSRHATGVRLLLFDRVDDARATRVIHLDPSANRTQPPPTTILVGEKTLVAPRAVARLLGRALEATTIVVPGAAHMIPMTHPQAVLDAVRRKAAARNRSKRERA